MTDNNQIDDTQQEEYTEDSTAPAVPPKQSTLRETLVTLAIAAAVFILLQLTIQSTIVLGSSMVPTLEDGQRIIVSKVTYFFSEPHRGDIIVLHSPKNERTEFIKRVIGLPGDTVEITGGTVFVNGIPLDEPYIAADPHYTVSETEIEEDNYFVLGDNRNNSNDSHTGWTVPRADIVGKAWLTIWPIDRMGSAPNYSLDEQIQYFLDSSEE